MALNIKAEEADRLAHELAALTGESLTAAVTIAIRERLDRERREREGDIVERLLEIGSDCAAHLRGRRVDHGQMLYDERGLPR